MARLLRAAVQWMLKHPEIVQLLADAVTKHRETK